MIKLSHKQAQAFDLLTRAQHAAVSELLYGGGAGGGKSMLGCIWLASGALRYPGTRWVMGRATLKTLKETTLKSFFEMAALGGVAYDYLENKGITFSNGSEIMLKDLSYYPSDPEFAELGSLEITGAFVDECDQITEKAWNILKSRIRYRLDHYGLTPKILGTCNPTRNWVYDRFYVPHTRGQLPPHRRFVQSLVTDNPHISRHYITNLSELDELSRQRLMLGNWECYDAAGLWAYAFDRRRHLGSTTLNRSEIVYLSFDFNRNPITCLVSQHYGNTFYGIEQIEIDDCTIYRLCDAIKQRYEGCFFWVTGDVSGKAVTTVSQLNNFDIIKHALGCADKQMQYSGANPPLAQSRQLVNAMLERYPMVFDAARCAALVRDFESVKSDAQGRPVKTNRADAAQRADCLDTFRYTIHRWFGDFLTFFAT